MAQSGDRGGARPTLLESWRRFNPAAIWRRHLARANRQKHFDQGLVKVMFDLTGGDRSLAITLADPPQATCEWMWAEPLGDGRYKLRNNPFEAYGVSFHDVVAASLIDQCMTVTDIVERGGHSTYRIRLAERLSWAEFIERWESFAALHCGFERATDRLVAIDLDPEADIHAVYRLLEGGEEGGVWEFEKAHCGHPI